MGGGGGVSGGTDTAAERVQGSRARSVRARARERARTDARPGRRRAGSAARSAHHAFGAQRGDRVGPEAEAVAEDPIGVVADARGRPGRAAR